MAQSKTIEKETVEKTESVEKTTVAKEEIKPKRKFKQEDGIACRSSVVGGLWLDGVKSKNVYRWVSYGDVEEVEYRDLVALVRTKSGYVFGPMFVIEDEDFIEEFPQLKKFYDEQYTVKELGEVLEMPVRSMIATIKTLPSGAVNSLKNIASTQIANGQLDSVKKIKALDEYFGTELNLLASLFQ